MTATFIEQIAQGSRYDPAQVIGYSTEELGKIERLYDISVTGQFREFLSEMGRSAGGLIGDEPIFLYRHGVSVRRHMMFQLRLEFDFKECRIEAALKLLKDRPFLFSIESETQYFSIATRSENSDHVYQYDENREVVSGTGMSFLEYMRQTVRVWGNRSSVVSHGDLLII